MLDFIAIGKQMYRVKKWREAHRLIIFAGRAYLHYPAMRELYAFFQEDELRNDILAYNKFPIEQATRAFFYKGSTLTERTNLIKYHFKYLQARLKPAAISDIYHDREIKIWQATDEDVDWHAVLASHAGQRKESMMAIEMHYDGKNLYHMLFWLNEDKHGEPALWIGAMQGPNTENAREFVKETTKRAYRYRTKNLILYMTQALARELGVKRIYAVSNDGYYAMNHIRLDRKLKTDFGAFWEEAGGRLTDDLRFYELPLVETRKTMEEVPTRKRAVYRKRFAFQDDVDAQIEANMKEIKLGTMHS